MYHGCHNVFRRANRLVKVPAAEFWGEGVLGGAFCCGSKVALLSFLFRFVGHDMSCFGESKRFWLFEEES